MGSLGTQLGKPKFDMMLHMRAAAHYDLPGAGEGYVGHAGRLPGGPLCAAGLHVAGHPPQPGALPVACPETRESTSEEPVNIGSAGRRADAPPSARRGSPALHLRLNPSLLWIVASAAASGSILYTGFAMQLILSPCTSVRQSLHLVCYPRGAAGAAGAARPRTRPCPSALLSICHTCGQCVVQRAASRIHCRRCSRGSGTTPRPCPTACCSAWAPRRWPRRWGCVFAFTVLVPFYMLYQWNPRGVKKMGVHRSFSNSA